MRRGFCARVAVAVASTGALALSLISAPGAVASTTYFAAPTGSDAITCAANSHANPFATIQAALACTADGDTVSLAPSGSTPYSGIGTVSNDVTITAEAGANARTVEADLSGASNPLTVPAGASVTVTGVALDCVAGLPPDTNSCGPNVTNQGTLTLERDTVRGSTNGPGIENLSPDGGVAHLMVRDSTISDNLDAAPTPGAGIESAVAPGTTTPQSPLLNIVNSTIADNGVNGDAIRGGGVDVASGTATIIDSTISGNQAGNNGGGGLSAVTGANVQLTNTIIAGNTASSGSQDCSGTAGVADGFGHNLIGDATGCPSLVNGDEGDLVGVPHPGLNPLADNGGPTDTVGLQTSSPAIAVAEPIGCQSVGGVDQRGEPRNGPFGCDIGAYDTGGDGGIVNHTYFAAPTGSDAITCAANSHANPFATIQAALACTTDGDAIKLAPSGSTPYPGIGTVSHNVTIEAEAGANARSVEADVSGAGPLIVPVGFSATVEGLDIVCVDGLAPDFNPCGSNITNNGTLTLHADSVRGSTNAAAIKNFSPDDGSAHLTVLDSTISGNPNFGGGTVGAGIDSDYAPGTTTPEAPVVTIANSTLADNGTNGGNAANGGGIYVHVGTASIVNSTISGNHAQSGGGVAANGTNAILLSNTVVAGNTSSSGGPDCQSLGTSTAIADGPGGHNLIGDGTGCASFVNGTDGDQVGVADPGLNPLADNGGPTDTIGLVRTSPAIGAADLTTCQSPPISGVDQRGESRGASACDIGAFEAVAATVATDAGSNRTIGQSIHDTATIGHGQRPTGTIGFFVYGPNDPTCSGPAVFSDPSVPVSGRGQYTSGNFTPTALGTYTWIADYSGDSNNAPVNGSCGDAGESVTVTKASPSLTTTSSRGMALGGKVHDTAHLSGGHAPTGQIMFRLYGPGDPTCSKPPVFTTSKAVTGNGNYVSAAFSPAKAGAYRWTARYSGDSNNAVRTSACGAAGESVTVSKASPTLTTSASPNVTLGGKVHDTARLTGGHAPKGKITFRLYGPADTTCAKPPAFTTVKTVSGNGTYQSADFTPKAAGGYRWRAVYSGDPGNKAVAGTCNAAGESVAVTKAK